MTIVACGAAHHIPDDFTSLINDVQSRVFDYLPDDIPIR
jgi:5'-3' exonuclease